MRTYVLSKLMKESLRYKEANAQMSIHCEKFYLESQDYVS